MGEGAKVDAGDARPEGLIGALIVVVLLAIVGSTVIAVLGIQIQRGDSRRLAEDLLPTGVELPYGFYRAGGTAVANDQRWVRYARAADSPAEVDGELLPETILIGRFHSFVAVKRQFDTAQLASGEALGQKVEHWNDDEDDEPRKDFSGLLAKGTVPLGPLGTYVTDYVTVRDYTSDGHFTDHIRVNLTTGRESAQLLDAVWPEDTEGASVDVLAPLLELLHLELEKTL